MFEQYVKSTWNLQRYRRSPLADERERFLVHLREQGRSFTRLRVINAHLLAIAESIDLRGHGMLPEAELATAAEAWLARRTQPATRPTSVRMARTDFISIACGWLRFLGRLKETPSLVPFADQLDAFLQHLGTERGLAERTVFWRRHSLEAFLRWLASHGGSIETVGPKNITEYFSTKRDRPWKRATVKFHVSTLRTFFRYAASRNWCEQGIDAAIDGPRMYAFENLPRGPAWGDVQRLIASVSGDDPTEIRSRAAILLLAVYGLRSGEVCQLTLDDIDWKAGRIRVRRSKQRRTERYPLTAELGEAILRYLKEVRPKSSHRQIFLTLKTPYRPISSPGLGTIITTQLKRLNLRLPHYGPHVLRHACATHLLSEGFSLKEIGDHLGHRSSQATRIYAKVDASSLREVAKLDLSSLVDCAQHHPQLGISTISQGRLSALRGVARVSLGGLR
jgi:integrase/recombinase XerD